LTSVARNKGEVKGMESRKEYPLIGRMRGWEMEIFKAPFFRD